MGTRFGKERERERNVGFEGVNFAKEGWHMLLTCACHSFATFFATFQFCTVKY